MLADEHLEELKHLLEEMREDIAIGDCFTAGQRLDEALKLMVEKEIPDTPSPMWDLLEQCCADPEKAKWLKIPAHITAYPYLDSPRLNDIPMKKDEA